MPIHKRNLRRSDIVKKPIQDIIFVFGNPIRKIESMAKDYNLTIVGTNTPSKLINELKTANDVSQFFFIITEKEELEAVNEMFRRLKTSEEKEPNIFVLIDKKLQPKLKIGKNKVYLRDFAELTESVVVDMICSVAVHNQIQYFTEVEAEPTPIISKNKMEDISKSLNSLEYQNVLQSIKSQFGVIKQNQDKLSISKMVLDSQTNTENSGIGKVETQEFLKEKEKEIKEKLASVTNKEDLQDLMNMLLEIFNMRTEDLKESASQIIDKILMEETDKGKKLSEESQLALEELEANIVDGDKKELNTLVDMRNKYLVKLKEVETEVNSRVNAVKSVTVNYLSDLKQSSFEVLTGKHKNLISVDNKLAFQEAYKANGLIIKEKTIELVTASGKLIEDLQGVVSKYDGLMKLDTNIIETQSKLVKTLSTQKVTERVQYQDPLTAKLNLLVSPNPNIGASTLLKIFSCKWNKILVLDFRETSSNPSEFELIDMDKFMTGDLSLLDEGKIKVNQPLAESIDEDELLDRLATVEGCFDAIFIVVDKYMSIGVNFEKIQKLIYLSDTAEKNLIEINRAISNYEPLLENLNKRMLVLNKMTYAKKQDTRYLLIAAGVDPSSVRINTIDLSVALVDGDESEIKAMNSKFNYF